MSVERSARERMGVGTAKQSGVKNEDIRKPIVAYFATEKEQRCENVMEKEEDGAQGNYEPRKDVNAKTG